MTSMGMFFVFMRFLARWKKGLSIGADDYAILLSTIFLLASLIFYSMGRHAATLPTENTVTILLMPFECIYGTTIDIIKASILLMYSRIFPTRNFRIASIILNGIPIGWVIAIICVSVFQCDPIAKTLDVVFTSAFRFSTLSRFQPVDAPWTLAKACIWCLIECSSGIISSCLPTLRPLFVVLSAKLASTPRCRSRPSKFKASALMSLDNPVLRSPSEHLSKQNVHLEASQLDDAFRK
ncbi:hypothetical protein ABOM_000009 [Aspergillus bombycis]|uniref:Rhodopsin domain-containing protein n=1 Tax=Aspergillus bombycis TaxID=109264 RepID=A0A1F8AIT1_9EURO|nr:hypothetical protein ABOM_000009 [Aspergillus bombycis]OGM51245.1 hypothetical protein ABOM_000009 [Aspergillus bombycis]